MMGQLAPDDDTRPRESGQVWHTLRRYLPPSTLALECRIRDLSLTDGRLTVYVATLEEVQTFQAQARAVEEAARQAGFPLRVQAALLSRKPRASLQAGDILARLPRAGPRPAPTSPPGPLGPVRCLTEEEEEAARREAFEWLRPLLSGRTDLDKLEIRIYPAASLREAPPSELRPAPTASI